MTSIIKKSLKLTITKIKKVEEVENTIIVNVEPYKSSQYRCPICSKKYRVYDTKSKPKYWRGLDFASSATYLKYTPVKVICPEHRVHVQQVPWARHDTMFTKQFENWAAYMTVYCTISAVSNLARIDWHTVGGICKRVFDNLEAERPITRLDSIKRIGIDETSYKKGHKYLTVIVDHDNASLLWAHEGKSSKVLELFFKKLTKEQCDNIEVVTADGAKWIKKVVKKYCKNDSYCMDPFHVISWMNDALDTVRKEEWRIAKASADAVKPKKRKKPGRPKKEEENEEYKKAKKRQDAIKGTRFTLLKNSENLSESEENKIKNIKKIAGKHLFKAWEYKEDLLDDWMHKTAYCKIKPVVEVEKKLEREKLTYLKQ